MPIITLCPAQTVGDRLLLGVGNTVIVLVAVLEQPLPPVPVTEYVVDVVGTNPTPFVTPPDQTYEVAPLPVRIMEVPAQIVEAVELATTKIQFGLYLNIVPRLFAPP